MSCYTINYSIVYFGEMLHGVHLIPSCYLHYDIFHQLKATKNEMNVLNLDKLTMLDRIQTVTFSGQAVQKYPILQKRFVILWVINNK